jgi:sec-independent protein translocase protein TatC
VSAQALPHPTPPGANDPPPPASPPEDGARAAEREAGTMTILEHLEELRQRIIISGIALLIGMALSAFLLTPHVMEWLVTRAPVPIINISPPEIFTAYLKVALFTGAAIAMPVILYEAFMFVLPALTPQEKRVAFIAVPGAMLCFLVGVAFGYFILLPAALGFLAAFGQNLIQPMWSIGPYLSFVSTLLFWIGVAFEMPLVMFVLAKLRVVNARQLGRYRKYAFLGAFVVAAVITPTPDPFNQTLVGVPLYLLYELGVLLARWA